MALHNLGLIFMLCIFVDSTTEVVHGREMSSQDENYDDNNSNSSPMVPYDAPFYANQEEDPEVQNLIFREFYDQL